jgi:hypothetical protein
MYDGIYKNCFQGFLILVNYHALKLSPKKINDNLARNFIFNTSEATIIRLEILMSTNILI